MASINPYAEEKEHFLFAYDAPMVFQIHFCLTIIPRPCPYRDSFLTLMRVLTLNSSDGDTMNTRFSQTLPSINAEESKGRENS